MKTGVERTRQSDLLRGGATLACVSHADPTQGTSIMQDITRAQRPAGRSARFTVSLGTLHDLERAASAALATIRGAGGGGAHADGTVQPGGRVPNTDATLSSVFKLCDNRLLSARAVQPYTWRHLRPAASYLRTKSTPRGPVTPRPHGKCSPGRTRHFWDYLLILVGQLGCLRRF